ncbi:transcriptional regulator BetI [Phaeobacter sp. CECT 5382]|uniref:TetR/AcrR family transcriptional regulator n=1 Tax=Rhodobacterales TaxID=204455 RepID=UPI0006D9A461|nr:TetR/AcrR family transcriptional regulator [Phaeobacter sp. CECT 5382]CUH87507.1 transcriptional regulator BetI [Phaeobacter sp. CECT 5382]
MCTGTEDQPNVTSAIKDPMRGNPARVARTRGKIFDAVITNLDELGYSECSINRVQTLAGVSRGALTHHFPSKEEMMVKTLEHLLAPVRGTAPPDGEANLLRPSRDCDCLQEQLHRLWRRVINTREGRALMEILVAARTDKALSARITPSLWAYNDDFNRNIAHLYSAAEGHEDELALLWSICRSFMRGLHTQAPYERDPEIITKMVDLFGRIMAPHLSARASQGDTDEEPI